MLFNFDNGTGFTGSGNHTAVINADIITGSGGGNVNSETIAGRIFDTGTSGSLQLVSGLNVDLRPGALQALPNRQPQFSFLWVPAS